MYNVPGEGEVRRAVLSALDEHKEIASQKLLHSLVLEKLRKENQFYKLSPERVKRVAASMPEVRVHVRKRRSSREAETCYICGSPLVSIKVKNLLGETAPMGKKCTECSFRMDKPRLVPRRYLFFRR